MSPSFAIISAMLLARASSAAAPATPASTCDDCCLLPCVEQQLKEAYEMQRVFEAMAAQPHLTSTEYERRYVERANALAAEAAQLEGMDICARNLPEPNEANERRWIQFNWTLDPGPPVRYEFKVATDMEKCRLNQAQMTEFVRISACSDLGDATRKHEETHLQQCNDRKADRNSPNQRAQWETSAYQTEIDMLTQSQKRLLKLCHDTHSCRDEENDATAITLSRELKAIRAALAGRSTPTRIPPSGRRRP
jgi:hypothetical protein